MRAIDVLKAVGVAAGALALNMLVLTACIFVWSMFIETGHPPEYYGAAAPRIGAWVAPPTGAALLLLANWQLGRRRRERNPFAFAGLTWLAYAMIDVLVAIPMAPPAEVLTPQLGLSMLGALVGAMTGGALAARRAAQGT